LPHLAGKIVPFLVILPDESTRNTPGLLALDTTLEEGLDLMLEELELGTLDVLVLTLELVLTLDDDDVVATEDEDDDTGQPFTTP
jgi:hypothetical protein